MRISVLTAGVLLVGSSLAMTQPQPTGGTFHLTLTMPDSAASQSGGAQVNAATLSQLFGVIDVNHDGMLAPSEFNPWVTEISGIWTYTSIPIIYQEAVTTFTPTVTIFTSPFNPLTFIQGSWVIQPGVAWSTGSSAGPPPNAPPACPECSAELVDQEQRAFFPDTPCGTSAGSLRVRTLCNMQGFNSQPLWLPDGYDVDCFAIQAQTGNQVAFTIYPANNPNNIVYDSRRDGLEHLGTVHLGDTGTYRVDLDMSASDPGARMSVAFVGHPE